MTFGYKVVKKLTTLIFFFNSEVIKNIMTLVFNFNFFIYNDKFDGFKVVLISMASLFFK